MAKMDLNYELKEKLIGKAKTEKEKDEIKGMLSLYEKKMEDGTVSKAEVAAVTFKIASLMTKEECEQAAGLVKHLFMEKK